MSDTLANVFFEVNNVVNESSMYTLNRVNMQTGE